METHISEQVKSRPKSFSEILFTQIDAHGYKNDAELYKKAGIDRRHFAKIRRNPNYRPKRPTVYVFALALELNLIQTEELLTSAGYVFLGDTRDIIVKYCIEHAIFNIFDINAALHRFGVEPLLL